MKYLTFVALVAGLALAQPYRCDWSAVGIGGGEMASTNLRAGTTAGIPAGYLAGSGLQAFIGFWLTDAQVGVREVARWSSGEVVQTRLESVRPNPARGRVAIRFTLDASSSIALEVHDMTGRVVATLQSGVRGPGAHGVVWDGRDASGRELAEGVYFVRLTTDGYRATEKVLLAR
jgi:hypothetical protein